MSQCEDKLSAGKGEDTSTGSGESPYIVNNRKLSRRCMFPFNPLNPRLLNQSIGTNPYGLSVVDEAQTHWTLLGAMLPARELPLKIISNLKWMLWRMAQRQ